MYSDTYSSPSNRARVLVALLGTLLLLNLLSAWSSWLQLDLLERAGAGMVISEADATANDTREQVLNFLYMGVYLATGVMFLMWFHKVYRNLPFVRAGATRLSPRAAVVSFLIPIVNLFRPYQLVKEVWERCAVGNQARAHGLLSAWWAAWILDSLMGQLAFRHSLTAETVRELIAMTSIRLISCVTAVPATVLAIVVVWRVTLMQEGGERSPEMLEAFS